MGIRVVTIKEHRYGTPRTVGEQYEVPGQSHLQLVKAMGWAREYQGEPEMPKEAPKKAAAKKVAGKKAAATYQTRDMVAAPAPSFPPIVPPPAQESAWAKTTPVVPSAESDDDKPRDA